MLNEDTGLSAEEWGRKQAELAPPWSDAKWLRMCAILRIVVAAKSATTDQPAEDEPGQKAA